MSAPDDVAPPVDELYTPAQIGVATCLGTPIAGAILASINFARMGSRISGFVAIAGAIGLIALALLADAFWSSAALFFAVPVWTFLAVACANACFAHARGGSRLVVLAIPVVVIAALTGVTRLVHVVAPDAVPGAFELVTDAMGMRGGRIRYGDRLHRDDALKIRSALEDAGLLGDEHVLVLDVTRERGQLVMSLQLPDNEPQTIDAVKHFTRVLVDHMRDPECIQTRVFSPYPRSILAEGRTCPRTTR